jgi:hypothetical protein
MHAVPMLDVLELSNLALLAGPASTLFVLRVQILALRSLLQPARLMARRTVWGLSTKEENDLERRWLGPGSLSQGRC